MSVFAARAQPAFLRCHTAAPTMHSASTPAVTLAAADDHRHSHTGSDAVSASVAQRPTTSAVTAAHSSIVCTSLRCIGRLKTKESAMTAALIKTNRRSISRERSATASSSVSHQCLTIRAANGCSTAATSTASLAFDHLPVDPLRLLQLALVLEHNRVVPFVDSVPAWLAPSAAVSPSITSRYSLPASSNLPCCWRTAA